MQKQHTTHSNADLRYNDTQMHAHTYTFIKKRTKNHQLRVLCLTNGGQ